VSRLIASLSLLALVSLLVGCASDEEGGGQGDLPQAQPATWEGGLPGMTPSGPPR
jgi:hypothetical protein